MILYFLRQFFLFGKLSLGTLQHPYQTYRQISVKPQFFQLFFIGIFIWIYLVLSTLTKEGLRSNPLFLTTSLVKVGISISLSFIVVSLLLYFIGKLFGGEGKISIFILLWAFSLIPTLCWFLLATIFYIMIPPPRTMSLQGQIFSAFYLGFSISCFLWKAILYYLTFRMGLHLNMTKVLTLSAIVLPFGFLGSTILYKLGVFKVPFI